MYVGMEIRPGKGMYRKCGSFYALHAYAASWTAGGAQITVTNTGAGEKSGI